MSAAEAYSPQQLAHWGLLRQVRREALIDGCIKDVPPPEPETFKKLLEQWCAQLRIDSPQALQRWQQQQGLSADEWQAFVARRWRWLNWCETSFANKLNSYYLERKPQLDQVSYSMLRVSDQALANELYLRIKEGEATFEQVASEYSAGPERNSGGQLGPVPMQQPHPVLARLLQVSSPGQLWSPKQLENWWIVVRLNQLHTTELDSNTAQQLALELGEQHLEQILELSKTTATKS